MFLLVVAVGCGLAASYLTQQLLANRDKAFGTVKVLVAKKRISSYTLVKDPEALFTEKDLPENFVPKKAITTFADVKDKKINKVLSEDSILLLDDLADAKTEGLSANLGPGERAVAIRVNAEKSVAGFVIPGSRVDVVATVTTEPGPGQPSVKESKIILQNMLVLAVDTKDNKEPDQRSILGQTVTLAAKPEEAQRLALAQTLGELQLILRASGDREPVHLKPLRASDLNNPLVEGGGSDSREDEAARAHQTAAPVPVLPAVVGQAPEEKPEEKPAPVAEVPAKKVETHTMTIQNGENAQRAIFTRDEGEAAWKNGQLGRIPDDVLDAQGTTKVGTGAEPAPRGPARPPAAKK
jgi:pilus assembly protein CpaB